MVAYTDYPFKELGDVPYRKAPIRECIVRCWDGNKYAEIEVKGIVSSVKIGYLYTSFDLQENISTDQLVELP